MSVPTGYVPRPALDFYQQRCHRVATIFSYTEYGHDHLLRRTCQVNELYGHTMAR
jgi:hypothetical protein